MKRKRVAIYCRVDRGGALAMHQEMLNAQKWKLRQAAENRGLEIVGYYEDNGSSGHDMERQGLVKLLKDSEAGAFEIVLVANRSRLFRGSHKEEPRWPFQVCSLNRLEQTMER